MQQDECGGSWPQCMPFKHANLGILKLLYLVQAIDSYCVFHLCLAYFTLMVHLSLSNALLFSPSSMSFAIMIFKNNNFFNFTLFRFLHI